MSILENAQKAKQILWFCGVCVAIVATASRVTGEDKLVLAPLATNAAASSSNSLQKSSIGASNLPTLEVAHSVMITAELNFGRAIPTIAGALQEIERHSNPVDGFGRTFAILDAYGEPTASGKLHISMHISAEKPGLGSLVFRPTGDVLWKSRIVPATSPPASSFAGKNLLIMISDGQGKPYLLDGSKGSPSVLDAIVRDLNVPVREFWPDGAEREATFFYSACGCPVKVTALRFQDKTVRTKELPVIFPDDPAIARAISRLMGWE
jgi:hypothetical protein